VVEGNEIYNFPIHHFVHFYSTFWSFTCSNRDTVTQLGQSTPRRPRHARRAPARPLPRRSRLAPSKAIARLSKAPRPENASRSAPPYRLAQRPAVRRMSSGRKHPEAPPCVHRSLGGTRIDYKRRPLASRTGTAGLQPPCPPPAPVPPSARVVLSPRPTPHCRPRPSPSPTGTHRAARGSSQVGSRARRGCAHGAPPAGQLPALLHPSATTNRQLVSSYTSSTSSPAKNPAGATGFRRARRLLWSKDPIARFGIFQGS
jgi:hypothetical protein